MPAKSTRGGSGSLKSSIGSIMKVAMMANMPASFRSLEQRYIGLQVHTIPLASGVVGQPNYKIIALVSKPPALPSSGIPECGG